MTKRLENKTALVTAAGAGIGQATALAFAREGAQVWATDIDAEALSRLNSDTPEIRCHFLDVTDSGPVKRLADTIGKIDILFNCAGFVHDGDILACEEADWDFSFDLNVKSCYRTIRAVLPGMLREGGGSIINMASVASSIKGVPNRFVYGATKAAVIGLTKAIAADYVKDGIRCNAICPGTINSSLAAGTDEALKGICLGRLGTPEDIGQVVAFLATAEPNFITGQTIAVDGCQRIT